LCKASSQVFVSSRVPWVPCNAVKNLVQVFDANVLSTMHFGRMFASAAQEL
jgi:hypothetical protein